MSVSRMILTLFAAAVGAAAVTPASAQSRVGTLTCTPYDRTVTAGLRRPVRCVFVPAAGGTRVYYRGTVYAADDGGYVARPMTWQVLGPRTEVGVLAGTYAPSGALLGTPDAVLIGGSAGTVRLRPVIPVDRGISLPDRLILLRYGGVDEPVDTSPAPGPPSSDIPQY